ncbi:MAG: tetratricopeptide repeat protein [Anaerolineae bacterium]
MAKLPSRLTPFVGRQADIDRVVSLLADPEIRLITIRGMGGAGKTALALEVVRRLQDTFESGAAFVPLAHLTSVNDVLPALAEALDVELPPSGDLQQAALDQLSNLQLLLVMDSFEGVLDEAALLREILLAAPRVKILITSREKLKLEAETLYDLGGLELPLQEQPEAEECDAVRLFLQRARQVRPAFVLDASSLPAVMRLCRMVDGNPLGILLAASWVEHFSPAEIAGEAEHSLDFLTFNLRDVEPRHSCLRAVFESSFQRLDGHVRGVLGKLSVFRGGFDLRGAQAVAGADLMSLIALVERSLLTRLPDVGRYELHGLLQQYAREQLEASGELERVLEAHASYYCDFVHEHEPRLIGDRQAATLDEIQADLDNIRQAWTRLIERRDQQAALRMLPGLYAFSDMRTRFYEGEAMFRQAAEGLAPQAGEQPHGAWTLALLSWFDMHLYIERPDSYEQITQQAHECLESATANNDGRARATSLVLLGAIAQAQHDYKAAIRSCQHAMQVCPALDDFYWVKMRIGLSYEADRQFEEAIRTFEDCLQRGRRTGERVKAGWALQNMGDTLMFQGKHAQAEACLLQALEQFQQVGTRIGVLWSTYSLAHASISLGKAERARALAQSAAELAHQVHSASWIRKADELRQQLSPGAASPIPPTDMEALSQRELEVLQLLKSELSGPEIADRLVVSLNTVRFHSKHIYQKLGVNSRLEAIRRAKELGL